MLLQHDGEEDGHPIPDHCQGILEDLEQFVSAAECAGGGDCGRNADPDPLGDSLQRMGKRLEPKGCRVRAGNRDFSQGHNHPAKFPESAKAIVASDDEGSRRSLIHSRQGRVAESAGGEANPQQIHHHVRCHYSCQGHGRSDVSRRRLRVAYVEVGGDGCPADRGREAQREEGQSVRVDGGRIPLRLNNGVESRPDVPGQHEESGSQAP